VAQDRGIRFGLSFLFAALLLLGAYGTLVPAGVRCTLPGAVGCPGGFLGAPSPRQGSGNQWFAVVLYDYGFWVTNTVSGANESSNWTIFEGFDIHVNSTSQTPDSSLGGTAAHGLGLRWSSGSSADFLQNAPIGSWVAGSFVAPASEHTGATVFCTNYCGSGHSGMTVNILEILPAPSPPTATASASPTHGYAPLKVVFSASGSGGAPPYLFSWSFGDGATSLGATPSHIYGSSGVFTASVTCVDRNGLTGSASLPITALGTPPFVASATARPASGLAPLSVALNASAIGGLPPYLFSWQFGDGGVGSGANLTHRYVEGGSFEAVVSVEDSRNVTTSASVGVNVTSTTVEPLELAISVSPSSGDLPLEVNGSASVLGGSGRVGPVSWDFGDGSPRANGAVASHVYGRVEPERINVTAFVSDAHGDRAYAIAAVELYAAPSASLAAAPPHRWAPALVPFALRLAGGNGSFATIDWDFGDGSVSPEGPRPSHLYSTPGNFRVSVTTFDSTGRSVEAGTWVNLTVNTTGTGGNGAAVYGTVGNAPLLFLAVVGVTGLLLLALASWRERRTEAEGGEDPEP
jgi:PKD repeat protein